MSHRNMQPPRVDFSIPFLLLFLLVSLAMWAVIIGATWEVLSLV